jgi:uncharacterized protein (DUF433 family)
VLLGELLYSRISFPVKPKELTSRGTKDQEFAPALPGLRRQSEIDLGYNISMASLTYEMAIERNPAKVSGELLFRDTRVPISALFENFKDGVSIDQFLEWFPGVKREQILAVLDHEIEELKKAA